MLQRLVYFFGDIRWNRVEFICIGNIGLVVVKNVRVLFDRDDVLTGEMNVVHVSNEMLLCLQASVTLTAS